MNRITKILLISLCLVGCVDNNGNNYVNHSLNYDNNVDGKVESIDWDSTKFEEDKRYSVRKYTLEEIEQKDIDFNAKVQFYLEDFELPLTISFKYTMPPERSHLYFFMEDCEEVELGSTKGYNTSLIFNELYSNSFILEAMYDRELSYKIKINALLRYGGLQ